MVRTRTGLLLHHIFRGKETCLARGIVADLDSARLRDIVSRGDDLPDGMLL